MSPIGKAVLICCITPLGSTAATFAFRQAIFFSWWNVVPLFPLVLMAAMFSSVICSWYAFRALAAARPNIDSQPTAGFVVVTIFLLNLALSSVGMYWINVLDIPVGDGP